MSSWESVCLMVDRSDGSRLQKERLKKKFMPLWKTGQLQQALTREWKFRLCSARIILEDFSDYTGWELRDDHGWAEDLYWLEFDTPKWGGGYVPRLVVMGEQGLGDQIRWASLLPECLTRVGKVIYECDERLHTILGRSLGKNLECRPMRAEGISSDCDAYIPAAELMRMFRRDARHFPRKAFLRPDEKRLVEFERFTGKTGISWSGRQGRIPPQSLGSGVNLQYDDTYEGFEEPEIDLRNDIEGVMALCAVLERVVCVPTSILHIAGAIGKRVEVIEPSEEGVIRNQLRWDSPPGRSLWYPDVTVYRSLSEWKSANTNG